MITHAMKVVLCMHMHDQLHIKEVSALQGKKAQLEKELQLLQKEKRKLEKTVQQLRRQIDSMRAAGPRAKEEGMHGCPVCNTKFPTRMAQQKFECHVQGQFQDWFRTYNYCEVFWNQCSK